MEYKVEQAVEILRNTPTVLRTMLHDVSDVWAYSNYGPATWSPFDIVGHLIHGERTDWVPRAKIILEHGEATPFEPFDRYAQLETNKGKTIGDLLDEFESVRAENIETLFAMRLTDDQLARRGTHPALGSATLRELLAMWAVHDLNHIAQMAKAMAFQYRDQVGPWLAYASILRPPDPA